MTNKKKADIINCVILGLIVCFIGLIITRFKYEYGSLMDWETQHYEIPNYFRTYFYDTGDFFPDFALNLGAGQNIYNYSYYGLYSPIILLSYLLPFVSMKTYIQVASFLGIVISVVLLYIWLRGKYSGKVSFYAAFMFTCASPLIFHSHRHIMFVNYMPFLILALIGVDRYFKDNRKKLMLVISTFLIIMSSYFYSIGAILAITLYAVCVYIKTQPEVKLKEFMVAAFKYAGLIITSVLMSGILLLPTLYTLLNGRSATNSGGFDYKNILIPSFNGNFLMYSTYSVGLTSVIVLAIIYGFMSGMRHLRLTSTVVTIITFVPAVIYALNGTMYIDSKVLIPFLPVCAYLIASFADKMIHDIMKVHQLIKWSLIANMFLLLMYTGDAVLYYALDILISIYLVYVYQIKKKRYFFAVTAVIALGICIGANVGDDLVEIRSEDDVIWQESVELSEIICEDGFNDFRIGNSVLPLKNMNWAYNTNYNCSTIYSSVCNSYYKNFYYNEICNENPFRNSAMLTQPDNIMFDIYMGQRYLLLDNEDIVPVGYKQVAKKENSSLYENEDVLSFGSASDNIIPRSVYEELEYPYNVVALIAYNVIEDEFYEKYTNDKLSEDILKNIEKQCMEDLMKYIEEVDISGIYEKADKNIGTVSGEKINVWIHDLSEETDYEERYRKSISLKLDRAYENEILFVNVDVDNSNYLDTSGYSYGLFNDKASGTDKSCDVIVSINGCSNKLTNPNWKYYNNNTSFHYCLADKDICKKLDCTFYDGEYTLENFRAYSMNYESIEMLKKDMNEFEIDKEQSGKNKIVGKVSITEEKSIFTMSLPYDEGFKIFVDGKETECEIVDTGFIGAAIESGSHDIEIVYEAPLKNYGMYMSIAGFVMLFGIVVSEIVSKKGKTK